MANERRSPCKSDVTTPGDPQRTDYRSLLDVMALSVEMGHYGSLEAMISQRGHSIEALNAEGDVSILDEMRKKLAAGEEIEMKHGRGSLLNLDHEHIAYRLKDLPPDQVENARRYRRWRAGDISGVQEGA